MIEGVKPTIVRAKLIMNPQSGEGKAGRMFGEIAATVAGQGQVDLVMTERPQHATELAAAAAGEGYELVVAVGGDGTVHEVVNGLMAGPASPLPLAIIPLGSGNDFAYALGVPEDPIEAAKQLFNGRLRTVDLATVSDEYGRCEYWTNNLGIGFDAEVVIRTKAMPNLTGFVLYLVAVFQTIAFHYDSPVLDIQTDNGRVQQPALFLTLGNGCRHGGGFLITPDAVVDDGLIDSCLVDTVSRLTMLQMLGSAIKGTHVTSEHVTMGRSGRLHIRSATPLPIHIDGEMFAYPENDVHDVTVEVLPLALSVMV